MAGADRAGVVASGFVALLASQISTRLVTFVINLLIARHLSPEAYGLSSFQFQLLTTTALYISREGFRRGCLRFGAGEDDSDAADGDAADSKGAKGGGGGGGGGVNNRSVLRVALLVVPWGVLVTAGVCALALWQHARGEAGAEAAPVPFYREAVVMHGLAAVIELLAEPLYILVSVHLLFRARVVVEFCSMLTKSLVTLALVRVSTHGAGGALGEHGPGAAAVPSLPPALVFSFAQLAMALVALVGYGVAGLRLLRGRGSQGTARGKDGRGAAAGWLGPLTARERDVLWTSSIFTLQAVEKLALSDGSKVVLAALQSAVNQGVYGLVSNLGSMAVRVLFLPLEEAAFAAFSAWGAEARAQAAAAESADSNGSSGGSAPGSAAATGQQPATGVRSRSAKAAGGGGGSEGGAAQGAERGGAGSALLPLLRALSPLVKMVTLLGLTAAAFGPSYSYTLLRLLYGTRWSETEAPAVLAAYSIYVGLLALNGIGEAFVHAVLDARGLQRTNALLLVFSAGHLAACVGLVRAHGALGLVAADSVNALMRIAYAAWCIRGFFAPVRSFSLTRDLLPTPATLGGFAVAAGVVAASNRLLLSGADGAWPASRFLKRAGLHVGVGVLMLGALLAAIVLRTERDTLRAVRDMRRSRGQGSGGEGGAGEGQGAKSKEE